MDITTVPTKNKGNPVLFLKNIEMTKIPNIEAKYNIMPLINPSTIHPYLPFYRKSNGGKKLMFNSYIFPKCL